MNNNSTFRTTFPIAVCQRSITYQTPVLWIGSCFTENIGQHFESLAFPVRINPFGIIYNPMSLATVLERIVHKQWYVDTEIQEYKGIWFSWDHHHQRFANNSLTACLEKVNTSLEMAVDFWKNTAFVCITFGTAFVYHESTSGQLVANCHKLPARYFQKSLLTVADVVERYSRLIAQIVEVRPDIQFVFTLSPVRHWADGAVGNQRSKAVLLAAIHEICERFAANCYYFPAYELLLDDLRDYRFYANDMLHPSEMAQQYILERFMSACVATNQGEWIKEIEQINAILQHRPNNPHSIEHQTLLEKTMERLARWKVATKTQL